VTGEELEKLMGDISGQIEQLADDTEKPLSKAEKRRRAVLRARLGALEQVRAAQEEGDVNKETRANLDYTLLTEYGEKHPLLFNFVRSQMSGWMRW
jgi:hypothetical protein